MTIKTNISNTTKTLGTLTLALYIGTNAYLGKLAFDSCTKPEYSTLNHPELQQRLQEDDSHKKNLTYLGLTTLALCLGTGFSLCYAKNQ